jgi:hypothetical protein
MCGLEEQQTGIIDILSMPFQLIANTKVDVDFSDRFIDNRSKGRIFYGKIGAGASS